jgi:Tetratricopeptide repeat
VARNMLTAGGADQTVSDLGPQGHSVFTWTLLKGLEGPADLNGDHVISATELYGYLAPQVSAISAQTPAFGNLPGSEGGEFLLPLSRTNEVLSGETEQLSDADLVLKRKLEAAQRESADKDTKLKALLDELERAKHQLEGYARPDAGVMTATPPVAVETAAAFALRGLARYKEHDYTGALAALERSFELDGASAEVANNIGFVQFKLGHYDEALTWLDIALRLDPYRAVAFINQADVFEARAQNDKAAAALKKYLAQEGTSPGAASVKARLEKLTKKEPPRKR